MGLNMIQVCVSLDVGKTVYASQIMNDNENRSDQHASRRTWPNCILAQRYDWYFDANGAHVVPLYNE